MSPNKNLRVTLVGREFAVLRPTNYVPSGEGSLDLPALRYDCQNFHRGSL